MPSHSDAYNCLVSSYEGATCERTTSSASPSISPSAPVPYKKTDYPDVKYWTDENFRDRPEAQDRNVTLAAYESGKKQKRKNMKKKGEDGDDVITEELTFVEDCHGNAVSSKKLTEI